MKQKTKTVTENGTKIIQVVSFKPSTRKLSIIHNGAEITLTPETWETLHDMVEDIINSENPRVDTQPIVDYLNPPRETLTRRDDI